MGASHPLAGSKGSLEPMDLHDQAQFDELLRQRILCGWSDQPADLRRWRDRMDAHKKALFWIQPAARPALCAGHVSLDCEADPPDLALANPHDKSVLTIAGFFLLPAHRRAGLGRAVVAALERLATAPPFGSPHCRALAIHTLSRRYCEDDAERARFVAWEGTPPPPRGRSIEDWYARMGYVRWKDEPRYATRYGAEQDRLVAVFMRKQIAGGPEHDADGARPDASTAPEQRDTAVRSDRA